MEENYFAALYHKEKRIIDSILKKSLKGRKPVSLYEPGSYILRSEGKRLRPLLVLLSAKAVGGRFSQVYNAAAAVEMLHNFTLVHDDIMDNADKRRGRLTLHKRYDHNTAILVGDSLLSVAYEYLLKDVDGNAREVLRAFTKGLVDVCEGQSMDTDFALKMNVTIDNYILMITKKTAAMAEMCCRVGATIGGGSKKQIDALAKYGKNLGIAFQIQDDLLDICADEKEFGKTIGGDLVEGKKTFLFIKALEKSKGSTRKDLVRIIHNGGISKKHVNKYKSIYENLGVIEDARKEIKKYTKRALQPLSVFKADERKVFYWLADALIKRTR